MAFIQKDKNSRKDKLEKTAGAGTPPRVIMRKTRNNPRVEVRKSAAGEVSALRLYLPTEATQTDGHLEGVLAKLKESEKEESQSA